MRYRIAPLMLQVIAVSLVLVAISPAPALGQSLPPPPRAIPEDASLELHLELIVNQRSTGRIVPVTRQSGAFLLRRQDLLEAGLAAEHLGEDLLINLNRLDSLVVNYHSAGQQLYLEAPTHWLPRQRLDGERASQYSTARSSPGTLLNYDTFVRHQRHGATTASLDHEIRLFGKTGTLSSSGIYRQVLTGHSGTAEGYRRFNTRWEVSNQERLMTYAVGDVVTRPLGWSNAVRLGGIQLTRDFALRPDLVTYPLPDFSGEVDVPSTLDLFIDGARRSSLELEPGPFTLTNMPMVTGAGEATLVTVDAQGRRVESRLPFYVSSELLRPGWSSYNINAGALRRYFGQRDFSYGAAAATGSYRRGITNDFTLELQAEGSDSLAVGGVGGVFGLGRLGTLEASYQHSRAEGVTGEAYSAGYHYRSRRFNMALRHQADKNGFTDLAYYGRTHHGRNQHDDVQPAGLQREINQLTAGVSLGRLGSLSGGYFDVRTGEDSRTRLLNVSYSRSLWKQLSMSLSANREIGGDWNALVQFTLPLQGHSGTLSSSLRHNAQGETSARVHYGRSAPLQGGWGWNLAHEYREAGSNYQQADVSWRGRPAEVRGGVYGSGDDDVYFADIRGSVVHMDGQWFAANNVRDSFVVVSTDGQPEVPVRYENQAVGQTGSSGHLLVPWGRAYYPGKYEIDTLGLPSSVSTPTVEQRVAVPSGRGYVLRFEVDQLVAATLTLLDASGEPLPLGSRVNTDSGASALVGWDGQTYLERLEHDNRLEVTLPDGSRCQASFSVDIHSDTIQQLGALPCR